MYYIPTQFSLKLKCRYPSFYKKKIMLPTVQTPYMSTPALTIKIIILIIKLHYIIYTYQKYNI